MEEDDGNWEGFARRQRMEGVEEDPIFEAKWNKWLRISQVETGNTETKENKFTNHQNRSVDAKGQANQEQ